MHTFFINTSKQELNIFDEIFDIPREVRDLISLSCPLNTWMDPENGYKGCVRQMGELIDSYKDVTNSFNLILYVDMIAFKQYTSIDQDNHRERSACIDVMHMMLRHYLRETLVKELEAVGRKAQSVLIIFEENEQPNDTAEPSLLREYTWNMAGMPESQYIFDLIEGIKRQEDKNLQSVMEQIEAGCKENQRAGLVEGLLGTYDVALETLREELCQHALHVIDSIEMEKYLNSFYDKVQKYQKDDSREVCITSFVTNRYAEAQTSEMRAKRVVELDLFLLQCVRERSVTVKAEAFDDRVGRKFAPINWNALTTLLKKKLHTYNKAFRITEDMDRKYSDAGLAPVLYSPDSTKFGLDEFGNQLTKAVLVDVEDEEDKDNPEEDNKKKKKEKRTHKESRIQKVESSVFLDGYALFDPTKRESRSGDSVLDFVPKKTTKPEVYKQKAQELRMVHLRYLDALKAHVGQVLSNYAGRSVDNDPALLKKRDISIPEVDYDPVPAVINYSDTRIPEERSSKVAHDAARNGYSNAQQDYFEFYASRSVSLTDVEEPCNWLINRVDEITESLRRIKKVFFGLLAAVVVLYIPYFVIQWEKIIDDVVSVITALCSVAVPVALLTLVYFIMREIQKRKYLEVWDTFKSRSRAIMAENDDSTQKYDKLLSNCIPKLRWLYEYVTDVEFYRDCCEIARAKIEHHAFKQKEYATAIGNVLEDLQCENINDGADVEVDPKEIDFGTAFCGGEKNCRFYTIIGDDELKKLYEN